MDWQLVCERKELRATAQALFMTGVLLGSYVFGWLSDKAGRKLAFFLSIILQVPDVPLLVYKPKARPCSECSLAWCGITGPSLCSEWRSVPGRRYNKPSPTPQVGATTSGVFLVAYVLAMEMVGPEWRVVAGTLCQYYHTVGYLAMAGLAALLHHSWQLLQIVLTLPSVLFLSYWSG